MIALNAVYADNTVPSLNKTDKYVGCVVSYAIPLIHNGLNKEKSREYSLKKCQSLTRGLPENELEGAGDYLELLFDKF